MTCFSHRTDIQYLDTSTAKVILAPSESFSANRDFILSYRLAGDQIETGLLLYRGDDENYFLLMLQPPKDFHESEIPPREYIFVVDVSGSMHGYPLDVSKELLRNLVSSLRPVDLFNVLLFSGGSRLLAPESVAANQQNIRKAIDLIDSQKGGGGTELLPALERAFNLPVQKGFSRIFVIATDGYVTIEAEAFDFIRSRLGESNFFTFGIGTSVNRYLIEGLARTGAGEPFVVVNPQEATAKAEKFRRYVQSPLLTQNKLVFSGFSVFDVEPASIPDVFADRPIVVFGKWRGEPKGKISLHGTSGKGEFHKSVDVSSAKVSSSNSALRYLWARARIAQIDDYGRLSRDLKHIPDVTEHGLKYTLLTAYPSFVAVDTMVRVIDGNSVTIKQPLPLPEGVSDYAVGQSGPISAARSMAYHPASALPLYVRESGSNSIKGETEASFGKNTMGTKGNETGSGAVHLHPRLVKATASGVLSEVTLRRLVAEKLSQLTGCKAVLPIQPFKIKVKFTAVESGAVDDLHIDAPAHTPHEINRCIEEAIRKWSFPAAAGRTMVMITIVIG
jgi:Ca-activated chloride channel family protein